MPGMGNGSGKKPADREHFAAPFAGDEEEVKDHSQGHQGKWQNHQFCLSATPQLLSAGSFLFLPNDLHLSLPYSLQDEDRQYTGKY